MFSLFFRGQSYNKKMTYANKNEIFLEIPDDPDRCANPEGGAKGRWIVSACKKQTLKPA